MQTVDRLTTTFPHAIRLSPKTTLRDTETKAFVYSKFCFPGVLKIQPERLSGPSASDIRHDSALEVLIPLYIVSLSVLCLAHQISINVTSLSSATALPRGWHLHPLTWPRRLSWRHTMNHWELPGVFLLQAVWVGAFAVEKVCWLLLPLAGMFACQTWGSPSFTHAHTFSSELLLSLSFSLPFSPSLSLSLSHSLSHTRTQEKFPVALCHAFFSFSLFCRSLSVLQAHKQQHYIASFSRLVCVFITELQRAQLALCHSEKEILREKQLFEFHTHQTKSWCEGSVTTKRFAFNVVHDEYAYRIPNPYPTLVHQGKGTKYPR